MTDFLIIQTQELYINQAFFKMQISMLSKIESNIKPEPKIEEYKADQELSDYQGPTTCYLKVDKFGDIFWCWEDVVEIFGISDLVNFNFFDLMASYNKTYYFSMFGEYPIMAMKTKTTLRFTLHHLEEEHYPIVVTWKVKPIFGYENNSKVETIVGAIINARISSKKSTRSFRKKIQKCRIEASDEYIKQLHHRQMYPMYPPHPFPYYQNDQNYGNPYMMNNYNYGMQYY